MRTTEDLRAAFLDIADAATRQSRDAGVDHHTPAGPTQPVASPRWRTGVLVAAAVAAVGGTAVLVPLIAQHGHAAGPAVSNPPVANPRPSTVTSPATPHATDTPLGTALRRPAPGAPKLIIGFRVAPVAGVHTPTVDQVTSRFQAAEVDATSDWQQGNATGDITGASGTVYVFYHGAFDPSAAELGTPVSVHGKPGYFASIPYLNDDATGRIDSLVWQYAAGAWAVVQLEYPGLAQSARPAERAVADAVRGADSTLKAPFTLGHLPAGLAVSSLRSTLPGNGISVEEGGTISHVVDTGATLLLDGPKTAAPTGGDALYHAVEITYLVDPTGRGDRACGKSMTTRKINGLRLCLHKSATGTDAITAWFTHASMNVALATNYVGVYSDAQLEQLITSARYATNPLNTATWLSARSPTR